VTNRHLIADNKRLTTGGIFTIMRHVQDRTVLNIGASADPNGIHITPDDAHRPHRAVFADHHPPGNQGLLIDKNAVLQLRKNAFKVAHRHATTAMLQAVSDLGHHLRRQAHKLSDRRRKFCASGRLSHRTVVGLVDFHLLEDRSALGVVG
jgi:hypothetical protein